MQTLTSNLSNSGFSVSVASLVESGKFGAVELELKKRKAGRKI